MNFSINIRSSPKLEAASDCESLNPFLNNSLTKNVQNLRLIGEMLSRFLLLL